MLRFVQSRGSSLDTEAFMLVGCFDFQWLMAAANFEDFGGSFLVMLQSFVTIISLRCDEPAVQYCTRDIKKVEATMMQYFSTFFHFRQCTKLIGT